jgi:spore germination protein KC
MKKKISLCFMYLLIIHFLTGCWSRTELNELAIVTAMGIDKSEEGYTVSVQIINPSELAGNARSGRTEVVRFIQSGRTITEAIRRLSTDVPRKIYVAHLSEVIFGEEIAKDGIGKALDVLSRHHEMRSDFYLTVARGSSAADILDVQTAYSKVPADKIFNTLESSEKRWAATKTVTMDELISTIVSKGKEPVLMGIYVYGDRETGSDVTNGQSISPKTGIAVDAAAVFKKDKLQGWLNEADSIGFNYVVNNVYNTAVTVPCEGGNSSIVTISTKTKVKGEIVKDMPKIKIDVTQEGNIGEVECTIDLTKQKTIKELEEKYKNSTKEHIERAIKTVQEEYQSDIFGFGEVIHRADPKAWKRLEQNWDQEFAKLDVTVNVEAKIRRLGTITKTFQKEIEE